jgi:transposase
MSAVAFGCDPPTPSEQHPAPLRLLCELPPTLLPCDTPDRPCPHRLEAISLRQQAHFYKALHQRARQRADALKQEVAQLQAQVRDLRHRLFGRRSETHHAPDGLAPDDPQAELPATASTATPTPATGKAPTPQPGQPRRRARGQRLGSPGHGRRDYAHLPTTEEVSALPDEQCRCQRCGQPFAAVPGTDDTTVLEVQVKAHRRLVHRRRYRPTCTCGVHPGVVTAPAPPRLIPKSPFGVSLWVHVLLDKYLFYRPTQRLLADWRSHGLDLAEGSLTGGLQQLLPLFEPLYDALLARSQQQTLWHADETRWLVFASVEGKVGYRWYLWVFHAEEAVAFVLAMGRSHAVPEAHFGPNAQGIVVVDRYKAYPAMDQVKTGQLVLAFCWTHQRRDFVELARRWPDQQVWAQGWLERIGTLYHRNERRLQLREDSEGFEQRDRDLRQAIAAMASQAEQELQQEKLHPARRKVLESLGEHWTGLTVFVEYPEVPMDNNTAERAERGPVVGRKNYYGSGAVWSGRLAAMLFSLFATLQRWQLNPRAWLEWYLTACAESGGKAPAEVACYLPWNRSAEQRQRLQRCDLPSASAVGQKCPPDTS